MITQFLNEAMTLASNLMVPIWNSQPNSAYNLAQQAAMVIDRAKVYDIDAVEAMDNDEQLRLIQDKLVNLERDFKYRDCALVDKFILKWRTIAAKNLTRLELISNIDMADFVLDNTDCNGTNIETN